MGERETNFKPAQHHLIVSSQNVQNDLIKITIRTNKRTLCILQLLDEVRAMGGESFVLAIKMKCNDFSDKNRFLQMLSRQREIFSWKVQLKHTYLMYN